MRIHGTREYMGYEDAGYRDTRRQGYGGTSLSHGIRGYTSWDTRYELGY